MGKLTNEIIEQRGFERINNSMWRYNDVTLQNGHTHEGGDILQKILNTEKAYRFCYKGKFVRMIKSEGQLEKVITAYCVGGENDNTGLGKFAIQRVINCPYCGGSNTVAWGVNHDWNCLDCERDFEGCL